MIDPLSFFVLFVIAHFVISQFTMVTPPGAVSLREAIPGGVKFANRDITKCVITNKTRKKRIDQFKLTRNNHSHHLILFIMEALAA